MLRAHRKKPGWQILYNTQPRYRGCERFTLAHEFGHYLLHRRPLTAQHYHDGELPDGFDFECLPLQANNWKDAEKGREEEADTIASYLLIPINDYRVQVNGEELSRTLTDTTNHTRPFDKRIVPTITFKNGELRLRPRALPGRAELADPDRGRSRARGHEAVDRPAGRVSRCACCEIGADYWDEFSVEKLDYGKSLLLQAAFHEARVQEGIALRDALTAVFESFLDNPFTMQIGLFLLRLDRSFALDRMRKIAGERRMVA